MKITLIAIGKTSTDYIDRAVNDYSGRIARLNPFEFKTIAEPKNASKLSETQLKEVEGELLLSHLQTSDHVILLDERGKEYTSREFASCIEKHSVSGLKNLVFVIGGPFGFSEAVYSRANQKLALSKMTFTHEMVRLFFTEQIYRALSIINHLPYHHD